MKPFKEGQRCGNCNAMGKVWVSNGPDDGAWKMCDHCDASGRIFSSEWERDKFNGKL